MWIVILFLFCVKFQNSNETKFGQIFQVGSLNLYVWTKFATQSFRFLDKKPSFNRKFICKKL